MEMVSGSCKGDYLTPILQQPLNVQDIFPHTFASFTQKAETIIEREHFFSLKLLSGWYKIARFALSGNPLRKVLTFFL